MKLPINKSSLNKSSLNKSWLNKFWLKEYGFLFLAILIVSVIMRTFVLQGFHIPSGSMENTLNVGDNVFVNKLANHFSDIKRGEVVVFRDPSNWLGTVKTLDQNGGSNTFNKLLTFVGIKPESSNEFLVKRVIGVGGDRVQCCDIKGGLKVNGISVNEPYIFKGNEPSDLKFDITVKKNFIWVMGDHRKISADSRYHGNDGNFGQVPLKDVAGRAFIVYWPFNHMKFLSVGKDLSKIPSNLK